MSIWNTASEVSAFGRPSSPPDLTQRPASRTSALSVQPDVRSPILHIEEIPLDDPFSFYAALRPHVRTSFILESAPGPERMAEFTYIGFEPEVVIRLQDGAFEIEGGSNPFAQAGSPLDHLRRLIHRHRLPIDVSLPKYLGGLVGYIGYDFARYFEPLSWEDRERSFPDLELGLYLDGVIYDHLQGRAFYFTLGDDRSELVQTALAELGPARSPRTGALEVGQLRSDTSRDEFVHRVAEGLRAIREGELYQLVLSRRLSGRYDGDLFSFYRLLREINPSPYMYCLEHGRGTEDERAIIGSSPEMLVSARQGTVTTYPIAGTRPLGRDEAEQLRLRSELLSDEKERAEHNMLVDLARNDVGRVSAFGSVRAPEYMNVERFSHVQHIVSRVEGRLRDGLDAFDGFASLFPAGTVTGAPKLRAMEWIDRLEATPRGPYAGVVGYFSLTGDMDSAISIRTLFASGGELHLRAGAGVVADSDPEREWEETEHKLGALLGALKGGC